MADWNQIEKEFLFTTSRSSGAGGQHVNKVETQVRLCFSVDSSTGLSDAEKVLIKKRLSTKLDKENKLCITSQKSRSQAANKETAIEKMIVLIEKGLTPVKKRKKTRVPATEKKNAWKIKNRDHK